MNSNGLLRKHWFQVTVHFLLDMGIFALSYYLGSLLVFQQHPEFVDDNFSKYTPAFLFTAVAFASAVYITGLYSSQSLNKTAYRRFFVLAGCVLFAALTLIGSAYFTTARPLGRNIMLVGTGTFALVAALHHTYLLYSLKTARERVAYIVTSAFDEGETHIFSDIGIKHVDFVGVISGLGYEPTGRQKLLGTTEGIAEIVRRERIDRVLVTGKSLGNNALSRLFCKLRYSGVTVMPLIIMCEELDQHVPLELVSPEWLLNASGEPHLLYIRKVKRLFDIVTATLGLILSAPILLIAMSLIRLTSPGPVFFYQNRSGRFGRAFTICKLRTMRLDAEKDGVQWAQGGANGSRDPRVIPFGGLFRKYRIDEIPQLWNVIKGEMTFVGPRPERPEIIAELAKQIPFYEERMMVQPGITGWAQVNYPYGASVLDARRKLEYDLYYLKNMSLFLDVFILLDTVKTVLFGGAQSRDRRVVSTAMDKIEALKATDSQPPRTVEIGAV